MTVTASSGSSRVAPQRYDTLPLSSVRQAEQQDRFPDGGELSNLTNFFQSGKLRVEAARRVSANAEAIVARAANRIFAGGTPLSYLDAPLTPVAAGSETPLAADQAAFQRSVQTFTGTSDTSKRGNFLTRLLDGGGSDADVRVILPTGFNPISVAIYGTERMRKSIRDMAWFLRYVGYAVVAGDPSILRVNTRGLRDVLEKGCSLAATNVALQEMRAGAADLLKDLPEARQLLIGCFNVLLEELAVPTPSARQRLGSPESQGLQLPAIYALAAQGNVQRFNMKPAMSGAQKAEVIRAAYRQVFERDIAKAYSQDPCSVETSQVAKGDISMREYIRALGKSKEYRTQFFGPFSNSRAVELAFRHFLGRGLSSREEFNRYFSIVSEQGLHGLVDSLVNSMEYAQVFGEETVPYLRDLGEEAQESAGWGSNRKLFRFSAPFEGAPQYITLYASYRQPFADQHPYGGGNDPLGLSYGAIFPSGTAKVATRPAPLSYDTRRLLVGNGMKQPGQMNSPQFRSATPRRVGPKTRRLTQIATGGNSTPRRGIQGRPSVRFTESSTQSVIKAVYVQILGNAGYAGERVETAENRLENGDIGLKDFVREVARSDAFRRRYWSGLYICKAVEVMHRRILGRPTFGRWEIDSYFDVAARQGFYGVVDAMVNSPEYQEAFGLDTVPYERFITPGDLNQRRVPTFNTDFDAIAQPDLSLGQRPNARVKDSLRTTADITARNLVNRQQTVRGSWSAEVSTNAPDTRWAGLMRTQGTRTPFSVSTPTGTGTPGQVTWKPPASTGSEAPISRMANALRTRDASGYLKRGGIAAATKLSKNSTESELTAAINATYKQLLNRIPLESERLVTAESQLRNRDIDLNGFIESVAMAEAFQNRLSRMAPLRAASAAGLALLGRATTPEETTAFLETRATSGQPAAIKALLASRDSSIPRVSGLETANGTTQATIQRTAALYRGNAGMNPPTSDKI